MVEFQRQRLLLGAVTLALMGMGGCVAEEGPCDTAGLSPEAGDRQLATCLASDAALETWPSSQNQAPVVLYVDRSGSMRGFLDPEYPARVDYRGVLDRLIVALQPGQAYGFGTSLQGIGTSLGTLGDRSFYSDNNTELEDALERIAQDSAASATHLIIGDGRRSDPNAANDQYVRMRQLARRWIGQGGTFMVAASQAPFDPVPGDPAGCRSPGESEAMTCPLYAFAYIAPDQETRVVSTFAAAEAFEHLFIWPLPAASPTRVVVERQQEGVAVEPGWEEAENGAFIARVRGDAFTNVPARGRLEFAGADDAAGRAAREALAGHRLSSQVYVRPLRESSVESSWQPTGDPGSLVRAVTSEPGVLEFLSRGPSAERHLYKVERYPTGEASWLSDFDAESATDEVRTYGLGRLFELFLSLAREGAEPVQRAYIVVN